MKKMYIALLITITIILGVFFYFQKNRKEESFMSNRLPVISAQERQRRIDISKRAFRGTREQRRINRIAIS